jgi:hypothetical protein
MEEQKYTVDIEFPMFKIEVEATDTTEAFKEACRIVKKIENLEGVYFGEYIDFSIGDIKCTTKIPENSKVFMPADWKPN